jgi:hypothetical protein
MSDQNNRELAVEFVDRRLKVKLGRFCKKNKEGSRCFLRGRPNPKGGDKA